MLTVTNTFTYDSPVGHILISGDRANGNYLSFRGYDNIIFIAPPAFHALVDSVYLEDLITYATLEGYGGDLSFSLDSEDNSWNWSDDLCGEALQSLTFVAGINDSRVV